MQNYCFYDISHRFLWYLIEFFYHSCQFVWDVVGTNFVALLRVGKLEGICRKRTAQRFQSKTLKNYLMNNHNFCWPPVSSMINKSNTYNLSWQSKADCKNVHKCSDCDRPDMLKIKSFPLFYHSLYKKQMSCKVFPCNM